MKLYDCEDLDLIDEIEWRLDYAILTPCRNTKRFIKNIWRLKNYLWNLTPWDYYHIESFLILHLRWMADNFEKHGVCVKSDRVAKEMRMTARLFERSQNIYFYDDMITSASFYPGVTGTSMERLLLKYAMAQELMDMDRAYAFKFMNKHLPTWWD